ncbi:MAG TPA: hypothetical protein VMR74_08735 [Gammaproteobacteria bacterium]|nr:hypothetical protein [Gammaproteobacteria bacterium]
MTQYRIDFDALPWQQMRSGVRQKTYCDGGRRIRLVEGMNIEPGTRLLMVEDNIE